MMPNSMKVTKRSGSTASHSYFAPKIVKLTEVSGALRLDGPVPPRTYLSRVRLAVVIGFPSSTDLCIWMESEAFMPYYATLQANVQNSRIENNEQSHHMPRLATVQSAITRHELYGDKRYSLNNVRNFCSTIDWHALFLFHAVKHNLCTRGGAFFGKKMELDDVQARIWEAMLRANHDKNERQRNARRRNNARRRREQLLGIEASSSMASNNA